MSQHAAPEVPLPEAFQTFMRIGLQSFGGPAGQIAVMHRVLVEEKRWLSEAQFLHALSYCTLLPGPEAMQLCTYAGWLLHGTRGGLVAGALFVLPGFVSILALSSLYAVYGRLAWVEGLFFGIKPAVLALVLEALLRVGRRALLQRIHVVLAVAAFLGIYVLGIPFPWIVVAAGAVGASRIVPEAGAEGAPSGTALQTPGVGHALRVLAVWIPLWLGPVAILLATRGRHDVFSQIAVFFSQMAVVTFGGAYAVLAYVAQRAVETYGWLTAGEMLDGLGLAETTPGPLIQVLQFVAFLAAWRDPGDLPPWAAAGLASCLATWVTYAPCFLWIFLGAPWVERMRGSRRLRGALSGILAAVVGVIANLALWFSIHVLFTRTATLHAGPAALEVPVPASADLAACAIAAGACIASFRFHAGVGALLAGSAAAGVLYRLLA